MSGKPTQLLHALLHRRPVELFFLERLSLDSKFPRGRRIKLIAWWKPVASERVFWFSGSSAGFPPHLFMDVSLQEKDGEMRKAVKSEEVEAPLIWITGSPWKKLNFYMFERNWVGWDRPSHYVFSIEWNTDTDIYDSKLRFSKDKSSKKEPLLWSRPRPRAVQEAILLHRGLTTVPTCANATQLYSYCRAASDCGQL